MTRFPDWLEPMAATLTADRFSDPAWTFERKLDGIRLLAYKRGTSVELWSRNRLSLTNAYPEVARAIAELPVANAILDGEATGAWGRQGDADYHVFDVLWLNGKNMTSPAAWTSVARCSRRFRFGSRSRGYSRWTATRRGSGRAARDGKA